MRRIKPGHLFWKRIALFNMFIKNIHVSLFSINLCLENGPGKVYLKTYLSNTPNTVDQIQIQIQIHGLKFDQIQIQIQIRRICICICICKYKYVFDPSPATWCDTHLQGLCLLVMRSNMVYHISWKIFMPCRLSAESFNMTLYNLIWIMIWPNMIWPNVIWPNMI